jgi:putative intracellular protease/amidase
MPLPDRGYDLTEASIPWQACTTRGWSVDISTERGTVAQADLNRLKGPLPGLLSAGEKAREAYRQMTQDPAYQHPIPYAEIDPDRYQAILLPGGDALGMHQYLDSPVLQGKVLQFWQQGKLIGAICHGTLVPARTIDPQTGRSILYGRKVTAPPRSLDRFGYKLDAWLLKRGYIMYSSCVAEEVRDCLEHPEDFSTGSSILKSYAVTDGNLVTARWYYDAELFAEHFLAVLDGRMHAENQQ